MSQKPPLPFKMRAVNFTLSQTRQWNCTLMEKGIATPYIKYKTSMTCKLNGDTQLYLDNKIMTLLSYNHYWEFIEQASALPG